jgi:hypothetical protein
MRRSSNVIVSDEGGEVAPVVIEDRKRFDKGIDFVTPQQTENRARKIMREKNTALPAFNIEQDLPRQEQDLPRQEQDLPRQQQDLPRQEPMQQQDLPRQQQSRQQPDLPRQQQSRQQQDLPRQQQSRQQQDLPRQQQSSQQQDLPRQEQSSQQQLAQNPKQPSRRDQLKDLTNALRERQSMLIDKFKEYKEKDLSTNEYLVKVRDNYTMLVKKMRTEKEAQINALNAIKQMTEGLNQANIMTQMQQGNKDKQREEVKQQIDQLELELKALLD